MDDEPDLRPGDGSVRIRAIRLMAEFGRAVKSVMGGEDLLLEMDYECRSPGRVASLLLNIYNESGVAVCAAHTQLTRPDLPPLARRGQFRCRLRRLPDHDRAGVRLAQATNRRLENGDVAEVIDGVGAGFD